MDALLDSDDLADPTTSGDKWTRVMHKYNVCVTATLKCTRQQIITKHKQMHSTEVMPTEIAATHALLGTPPRRLTWTDVGGKTCADRDEAQTPTTTIAHTICRNAYEAADRIHRKQELLIDMRIRNVAKVKICALTGHRTIVKRLRQERFHIPNPNLTPYDPHKLFDTRPSNQPAVSPADVPSLPDDDPFEDMFGFGGGLDGP